MSVITRRRVLTLGLVLAGLWAAPAAGQSPAPVPSSWQWPVSAPEEQGLDPKVLADVVDLIRKNEILPRLHYLVIVRHGRLALEENFHGWGPGKLHALQSVSKGFTSALGGIAIARGEFKGVDEKVLAGVFEPETVKIADGELFVVEKGSILVYSLEDLRLLRKFGGQGEGPGEFKAADFWYNTVTVLADEIFVDGFDKTVRFSKDGRFLKEARKPLGISRMVPVGTNFAAVEMSHIEGDVQFERLLLYGADGALIRELARQESPVQSVTHRTEMIPDVLNFAVWEDRIYAERSRLGFVIDVFDSGGALLGRIEKGYERTAVTREHKDQALERIKSDPFVKRLGFERFESMSTLVWPERWPAIRDLAVADDRIYVRTAPTRDGRETWVILTLEGTDAGRADLLPVDDAPFLATLNGVKYHTVHNGHLYVIRNNERTDDWELFVERIK